MLLLRVIGVFVFVVCLVGFRVDVLFVCLLVLVFGVCVCGFGMMVKRGTPQNNTHTKRMANREHIKTQSKCVCCVLSVCLCFSLIECLVCCCVVACFLCFWCVCGLFGMMVNEETPQRNTHEHRNNNDKHDQRQHFV